MIRVSTKHLKPGMIVGKCVFSSDGMFLLGSNMILDTKYIERLRKIGMDSIYIKSSLEEPDIPEVISEKTRQQSLVAIKKVLTGVQHNKKMDIDCVRTVVASIVDEVILNSKALIHLNDIRTHDDYTFSHSVNVCILSAAIGISMGYSESKLRDLALGGLLHDVGKMSVSNEILNKPDKLTTDEMASIKRHSETGFEILRHHPEIPLLVSHVAFQHHEKFDGSGYPRGLVRNEIHEYARIVAIADVYDALISDRAYRAGMLPHEAYEILRASANRHFDEEILQLFFRFIAIYPVGTLVQLNTREIGVITQIFPQLQSRPVITIIIDRSGNLMKKKEVVNLADRLSVFIDKVLDERELFNLDKSYIAKLMLKQEQ